MFHGYRSRDCTGRRGKFPRGPFVMTWDWSADGERGRGRSRRRFDSGELRLVLLALIADEPRHGYDLIREVEDRTGGAYAPSPGVIYPTLTLLADMGLIEEQAAEGAKKLYGITKAGQTHLEERAEEVAALMGRLAEIGETRSRSDRSSVRRAMGNLRQVLVNRLSAGDVDEDAVHKMVELIDEAAQKIEKL